MEKHTGKITVGNLIKLRECRQKKILSSLTLNSSELERRFHVRSALDTLKSSMYQGMAHDDAISAMLSALKEGYKDEWFAVAAEKKSVYEKDEGQLSRLASYLYAKGAKVVGKDVTYAIELPPVSYHGERFSRITGKIDLVVEKDGCYEAIMFSQKEPAYSYAARREDTKPVNSLELLCMKLGIESRYPGVACSIYYLENKDDKAGDLRPYEHKKGKNIISQDYGEYSLDGLMEKLYAVVAMPVNTKCEHCVFLDTCKFPRTIKNDVDFDREDDKHGNALARPDCTKAQNEVIHHVDGPMNVLAVPGAGKTFSLVQRLLYLIREVGIRPSKILFVTFTKKACEEIRQRVEKALGTAEDGQLPNILTFNALGYQILKDNPSLIGRRVKLAGTVDRLAIIREAISLVPQIKNVSYEGIYMKFGLIRRLDREFQRLEEAGEELWGATTKIEDKEGVLRAYHKYKDIFEERELITYDMQISLCNELFEKRPDLAKLYSRVFSYIMVDEFQDVSDENVRLIYTIARHHKNIVVVGDDDQSIYSFRGGSNKYLLEFPQEFPNAETVVMNDNFRSNDKILAAAGALIENNQVRLQKTLVAHMRNEYRPILMKNFMPKRLLNLIASVLKKGYSLGDIAILGRYNKTLGSIFEMLSPYYPCNSPKDYLVDDAVFLMIADILNLYYRPVHSDRSVFRLFSWLGCESMMKKSDCKMTLLENVLNAHGLPCFDLANPECAKIYGALKGGPEITEAAKTLFECLKIIQYASGIPEALSGLICRFFKIEDHPVVSALCDMADERSIDSLYEFDRLIRDMLLFGDETRVGYASSSDAINLLTAHDAKGKEFPVVILYSAEEFSDIEEERRLFYVAMTRAKKSLFVTESEYQKAPLAHECEACMAVM